MSDTHPDIDPGLVTVTLCEKQVSKWLWTMKDKENYFYCTNNLLLDLNLHNST